MGLRLPGGICHIITLPLDKKLQTTPPAAVAQNTANNVLSGPIADQGGRRRGLAMSPRRVIHTQQGHMEHRVDGQVGG